VGGGSARKRHNSMSKKSVNNNLVGRRVVIDWPCRWQGATPENQATLKEEARKKEHYFGEEGEQCLAKYHAEVQALTDKYYTLIRTA
jgi:hypothetical protein